MISAYQSQKPARPAPAAVCGNLQLLENIELCGAVFNAFDFKFHLLKLPSS
jgi:hypothetical protein